MEEVIGQLRKQSGMGEGDRKFPSGARGRDHQQVRQQEPVLKELMVRDYVHLMPYQDDIHCLASEYTVYKAQHSLMDFDDLLLLLLRLLKEHPEARQAISGQYQYIMVDEYQDNQPDPAEIVYLLASERRNVMAVGDEPSPSILSWRVLQKHNGLPPPLWAQQWCAWKRTTAAASHSRPDNHIISRPGKNTTSAFSPRGGGNTLGWCAGHGKGTGLFVCRRIRELMAEASSRPAWPCCSAPPAIPSTLKSS
jgi:hypothetical protein